MTINDVLILNRQDLIQEFRGVSYRDIKNTYFMPGAIQMMLKYNIVLFVDERDNNTYIYKNRFGKSTIEQWDYLLKLAEKSTERYLGAEKFIKNLSKNRFVFNLRKKCTEFLKSQLEK